MWKDTYLISELEAARDALERWRTLHLEMALRLRRGRRSGLVQLRSHDESQCRLGRCLAAMRRRAPGDPYVEELCWLHEDFHAYAEAVQQMIATGQADAAITALTGMEYEARRAALSDHITQLLAEAA